MQMIKPNFYVHHAFSFKIDRKGNHEARFLVISRYCLYNVEIKKGKSLTDKGYEYKSTLWSHPIEGLLSIELENSKKTDFVLTFRFIDKR